MGCAIAAVVCGVGAGVAAGGRVDAIEPVISEPEAAANLAEAAGLSVCAALTVAGADAASVRGDEVQNHTAAIRIAVTNVAAIKPNGLRIIHSFHTLKVTAARPARR